MFEKMLNDVVKIAMLNYEFLKFFLKFFAVVQSVSSIPTSKI